MSNGIYTAVSGAVSNLKQLDVVANNLANVSTAGFKAQRVSFEEILTERLADSKEPGNLDSFVKIRETAVDLQQGALERTANPLSLALEGPGYVTARDENGAEVFSRGGALKISPDRKLTLPTGQVLLNDKNEPIELKSKSDEEPIITQEGKVMHGGKQIAQLKLVEFDNPQLLNRAGRSLYQAPNGLAINKASDTIVRMGYIEKSNVNTVRAVSSMIKASRNYEAFHRVIATFREADSAAARLANER